MSTYGHPDKITPSIDRFAENSSVYLNTHSNATTTTPSMLSLFTGKHPFNHGRLTRALPIRLEPENVVNVLANFGYVTAAISSNVYAAYSTIGLDARLSKPESIEFNYLTLSWLRNLGVYPTRFGGRIYADLAALVPFLGYPNRTSVYGEVDETLDEARQAIAELRQPFFISIHIHQPHEPYAAESGKAAAEEEGNLIGIESNNPIKFYARYKAALTQTVDIASTILRTLKIPLPAWMDGQPLVPGKSPAGVATVALNYRYPENGITFPMPTKLALWWDRYKIIATCDTGDTELYNLSRDPNELVNLANRKSTLLADLRQHLVAQLVKQTHEPRLACPSLSGSPMPTASKTPVYHAG